MEKIDITEVLENSFSISIDNKKREIQKIVFQKENIPVPKFFPGYTNSSLKNVYRCSLSHESVLKVAKMMDLNCCLVFEEDAYPRSGAIDGLKRVLSEVPSDFDILIIGWIKLMNVPSRGSHLFRVFNP